MPSYSLSEVVSLSSHESQGLDEILPLQQTQGVKFCYHSLTSAILLFGHSVLTKEMFDLKRILIAAAGFLILFIGIGIGLGLKGAPSSFLVAPSIDASPTPDFIQEITGGDENKTVVDPVNFNNSTKVLPMYPSRTRH